MTGDDNLSKDEGRRKGPFDPRLLRLVPTTRGPLALLAALGVLGGLLRIVLAMSLAYAAVAVVGRVDDPGTFYLSGVPSLEVALWVAVGALVARGIVSAATEVVATWAGTWVSAALRDAVLARWAARPVEDRPRDVASAQTLATQGASSVEPYVAKYLPTLVHAAVTPVAAIITLVFIDVWSALIVVLTLPLLPLFAALIGYHTEAETASRWTAMSRLAGHFLDVMRGLPTLVGYGRGERQAGQVHAIGLAHRDSTMRTLRTAFMSSLALELLATISVAIVAVTVGIRLAEGHMELLPALAAILVSPEAYWPVRQVGAEFHNAADGAQALDDVLAEVEGRPAAATSADDGGARSGAGTADGTRARGDAVALQAVTYRYPGAAKDAVADVTLQAPAGPGLIVTTGPSGGGKSTVLSLLAGLRRPTAGTVTVPGPTHLVTQRPFLPASALRDALTLAAHTVPASDSAALLRACAELDLDEVLDALPDGLDSPLGDDGFGLSAGQRARLALARALLTDAEAVPVLLIDEPTAHLDAATARVVIDRLAREAQRRTVIVVTHEADGWPATTEWVVQPAGAEVSS